MFVRSETDYDRFSELNTAEQETQRCSSAAQNSSGFVAFHSIFEIGRRRCITAAGTLWETSSNTASRGFEFTKLKDGFRPSTLRATAPGYLAARKNSLVRTWRPGRIA